MDVSTLLGHFNSTNDAIQHVAKTLNISNGTVKRWVSQNAIPSAYQFDLMKIMGQPIDYTKYTCIQKDQFFTPNETAQHCYAQFCQVLKELGEDESAFHYIEPSAGEGSFLNVLPKERTMGLDVEPRDSRITQADYLFWNPTINQRYIVFGNPPFGLRGNLALRFINHSSEFAEFVGFILPQLFESDGKGVPKRRVKGLHLIYSEKIPSTFYYPDSQERVCVHAIFQVWAKHHENPKYAHGKNITHNSSMRVYSLSNGGTPSSTRNKHMFDACDIYLPSTCFGKENMRLYETYEQLPRQRGYGVVFLTNRDALMKRCREIDWSKIAFMSTNSAYNIRSSQIMNAIMK